MRLHCRSQRGCHACIVSSNFRSSDRWGHDHHIFYGGFYMPGMVFVSWGVVVSLELQSLILEFWYETWVHVARRS